MSDSDTRDGAVSNPGGAPETDFDVTAADDDDVFAVLAREFLAEQLAVHDPIASRAGLLVREGVGIRARTRSDNCYSVEVAFPVDVFEVFHPADVDLCVDVDGMSGFLGETVADAVAIRAKSDGSVLLDDGTTATDVTAETAPTEDEELGFADADFYEKRIAHTMAFTVPASRLRALVGADESHDHAGLTVDRAAGTAEVYFFDGDGERRTVSLELSDDEFVTTPHLVDDPTGDPTQVSTAICRSSIDEAMDPVRGEVTVVVSERVDFVGTRLEYRRGDGALPVYAKVSWRKGANEALRAVALHDLE